MGLQVRLRHALDEQVFDLEPRTLKKPILVGRSSEADLQVPSLTVANKHCVLFLHGDRWMAQPLASGGATAINGEWIRGAAALRVGDVIAVGDPTDYATIEIDPAGVLAGRTGSAAQERAAAAVVAGDAPQLRSVPSVPTLQSWQTSGASRTGAPPVALPPPPQGGYYADPDSSSVGYAEADADPMGWGAAAPSMAGVTPTRKRKAAKKSNNGAIIVVCVVATLAIGGVVAYVVSNSGKTEAPAPPPPPPPDDDTKHHKNIFDMPGNSSSMAPTPKSGAPKAAAESAASATPPAPADETASASDAATSARAQRPDPTDPQASSAATTAAPDDADGGDWKRTQDAADTPNQAIAIVKLDDYARNHPGEHTKEVAALMNDALDQLWWKRLEQIFNEKANLEKKIAAKTRDIADEPNPEFKKKLTEELAPLQGRLDHDNSVLKEDMGYTANTPPNTLSKQGLAAARAGRNAGMFTIWSKRITTYVRQHNAELPWGGDE